METKSELQKKLESKGYELIARVNPFLDDDYCDNNGEKRYSPRIRSTAKSDAKIAEEHSNGDFEEVRVEETRDSKGNPIPELRDVYGKRVI